MGKKLNPSLSVCFIGIDGSGKTSLSLNLYKELSLKGFKCVYLHLGSMLTTVSKFLPLFILTKVKSSIFVTYKASNLLTSYSIRHPNIPQLLLYIFVIIDCLLTHLIRIKPISRNSIVICDRYFFDWINPYYKLLSTIHMRIIPKPDITFLLDADENIIVQRMNEFDKERPIEDYRKGRKFYLSLVRGKGFYIIDANKDFKEVYNQIISIVMKFL